MSGANNSSPRSKTNMKTYHYIVDLDERGIYKCHVEHAETGKIIWEASNEESEDGSFWPVEDGFMSNARDMTGLETYLVDMEIIEQLDEIVYKG